jgi:DNA-directed RNA polymerase I subunit RPA43
MLVGVINKQSSTHIGLLVHNFFNASISKSQIPSTLFQFEQTVEVEESGDVGQVESEHQTKRSHVGLHGNWVHTPSGCHLDVGTRLEFVMCEYVASR